MLITTFKQDGDLYNTANNPFIFNLKPTMVHLQVLFRDTMYLRWAGNTALVGATMMFEILCVLAPAVHRRKHQAMAKQPATADVK